MKRGQPGGDVLHIVLHQGKSCGTIIYDSKNHKRWLTDHATKLKTDQLAANAEHAVLSTHKFPQGTGQLHIHDGVILANPARVVVVATMLRRHLVQMHTLKVSNVEQDSKKDALYAFITSERSTLLFQRIDARADALLELQKKETDWHQNHWKKQGIALRDIQKSKADLDTEISIIVGTIDQDDHLLSEDIDV